MNTSPMDPPLRAHMHTTHKRMHTRKHTHTHTHARTHAHVRTPTPPPHTHTGTHARSPPPPYTHSHEHTGTGTGTHIHTGTNACTDACIRTGIHTHTRLPHMHRSTHLLCRLYGMRCSASLCPSPTHAPPHTCLPPHTHAPPPQVWRRLCGSQDAVQCFLVAATAGKGEVQSWLLLLQLLLLHLLLPPPPYARPAVTRIPLCISVLQSAYSGSRA